MKYKLFGFQQVCKTSQRGFKKGLMRRYRLLLNMKNFVQEADNTDLGKLQIIFTPNLPKAILEELKALADAGAQFSQETLLSLASFIEDVQSEMEKVKEEEEETKNDLILNQMFSSTQQDDKGDVRTDEES